MVTEPRQQLRRPDLADADGQQVQMVTVEWIEDAEGHPVAVERVVEAGVLVIPDQLKNQVEDNEEEDAPR